MRSMLSVDDYELEDAISVLRVCLKGEYRVPLDVYTTLENFGIEIDKLIVELEKEIHGESEIHHSYWGC
jgi:hypothetical protein